MAVIVSDSDQTRLYGWVQADLCSSQIPVQLLKLALSANSTSRPTADAQRWELHGGTAVDLPPWALSRASLLKLTGWGLHWSSNVPPGPSLPSSHHKCLRFNFYSKSLIPQSILPWLNPNWFGRLGLLVSSRFKWSLAVKDMATSPSDAQLISTGRIVPTL